MALFIKKNGSLQQVAIGHEVSKDEQVKVVALDMAQGDQDVLPSENKVLSQVTITKPDTLVAGNIKNGVDIGGIIGTYTGGVDYLTNSIQPYDASLLYDYTNNDITTLRARAFYYDENLKSFTSTSVTSMGSTGSVFQANTNLESVDMANVTNIPSSCFYGCTKLTSVSLPSVTTIYTQGFAYCSLLPSISLPSLASANSTSVFAYCGELVTANFPAINTKIDTSFFSYCTKLQTCHLGNCSIISNNVFYECTSLTDVTLTRTSVCTLQNVNAFYNVNNVVNIHVPSNLIASYQTATNWSTLYNNGRIVFVAI